MIYYFLFILFLIFSFLEIVLKVKNNFFLGAFTAILILFAGARWFVGTDFNHYYALYETIHNSSAGAEGTGDLFDLVSKYFPSITLLLLFYAFFAVLLKILFVRKTKYPYTTFLLYYSFAYLSYDMGRMRQGLALAICIFSIFYIQRRRLIKFLICILFAFLAHKSSIIFVLLYPLANFKFNKLFMVLTVLLSVVLSFMHVGKVLSSILQNIPLISSYSGYFTLDSEYFGFSFSISNLRRVLLFIVFICLIDYKNRQNRLYLNAFYLGTLIFYIFRDFFVISERLSYYYCCFEIFLIPLCINNKKPLNGIFWTLAIGLYSFYYFYETVTLNADDNFNKAYMPYNSSLTFFTSNQGTTFILILGVLILFLLIYNFKNLKKPSKINYQSNYKKKELMR